MISNTIAAVDLHQLVENYRLIREAAGTRTLCIVKADAYGHGAIPCARALREAGADYFGVAALSEAIALRKAIDDAPILILGYTAPENASYLQQYRITQNVFSLEYARRLSAAIPDGTVDCHLKLDTGMNRLGFRADRAEELEEAVEAIGLPHLRFTGMFTHFACADMPLSSQMTAQQNRYFMQAEAYFAERGLELGLHHVSNSAAVVNYPEVTRDMVRGGILLYGFAPSEETGTLGCRPVMTLTTTISHVHTLRPGDSVGYGATFTAEQPMRIATLCIGYADGFVRAYSGANSRSGVRGSVYINGMEAPLVGRICMDQCAADVTHIPDVRPGMTAVVFDKVHTAERFAAAANTISYEVTSILTPRVERVYDK